MGGASERWLRNIRRRPVAAAVLLIFVVGLITGAGYWATRHFTARAQFRAAVAALDRRAWAEARTILDDYLRARPDSAAGHLLAARAARRLERLYDAGQHLQACERMSGPSKQIEIERALIRVHRGDLAEAEPFLRACVSENEPDTVEILDILSAALILSYRVTEAQQCLDELLRRQPQHFDALVRRAWTAQNEAWYPQAVEYLEKASSLRPEVDSVRLSLAELQVAVGRYVEAQQHFEHLRERQPNNPSVLFGLARCWSARGDKSSAVQLLDQILTNYPLDWKVLGERGWIAVQLDKPEEGEAFLRRAWAVAPPDLALATRLADCLRVLDKADEAREFQGRADRLKADIQRSQRLGDQIRERSPDDPNLRHELAAILLRLGKRDDAVHWFGTALAKDPSHRPTHAALGELFEKAGNHERAAHHRQALQRLNSLPGAAQRD